ncbi:portal protein [Roseovarius sp. MMSF_3350]|uniref:portal protein n=1 Tax=Roseovarius sp. MMSF_3350 TaxID=3046706 RepID=UPI00273E4E27|nr:portal protein [Roseovarius sp. MMSF_3350]
MKKDDIIRAALDRMDEAVDADRENREEALHDLEAIAGHQWPDDIRQSREQEGRPCLTINRLPQFVRQVTGDIRRMNPSINVLPGDSEASQDVAEIVEGLVRHIQYASDATSVYESAGESAAACSMGYFRIRTEYEDDDSFNQVIKIERIHNPFSVYFDPQARMSTREDADYCFITEQMRKDDFRKAYPKAALVDMENDAETDGLEHWQNEGSMVVAEYFWKEPEEYELGLLPSGQVVRDPVAPLNIVRKRKVKSHKVMWAKISGKEVLEGPQEIPCDYIPVVGVMGEELHVGDRVQRTSVIRFAKDPQQLYNYWRSAQTELVALQPKAPYLVTPKQVAGFETFWNQANDSNRPYLPYNPDDKAPGVPQRATPPIASQGMMQEVMTAAEDLKGTTGVYDAALGNQSNEKSGVAIRQRQMESDVSTSIYSDNVAKAVACSGRIIVNMIPKVYDTNRIIRILGKDDAEKMVPINGMQMTIDGPVPVNSLTIGKYDVKISVGPNYSTKRQEAAESMIEFVRAFPAAGAATADLIAKNMDWPGADEFADRLKKMLPPGIRDMDDLSPEEQQQMQAAMQQQQQAAQIEQAKVMAEIEKGQAEAKEAGFDAQKAQFEVMNEQLELAAKNGQLNAAIGQIVQQEVARALQGAMQQGPRPTF